jgi:hypothetical protein
MLNLKKVLAGLLGVVTLAGANAASAATWSFDQYTLDYADTANITFNNAFGDGHTLGFTFSVLPTVSVLNSGGGVVSSTFALPTFTVTGKAGYVLSGEIRASLGNLSYTEFPGAFTSATVSSNVTIDGTPYISTDVPLTKVAFTPSSGEYRVNVISNGIGAFSNFALNSGSLVLSATNFGSLVGAQSTSEFRISFTAAPVPEPESYAMLFAGLCLIGAVVRRRTRDEA